MVLIKKSNYGLHNAVCLKKSKNCKINVGRIIIVFSDIGRANPVAVKDYLLMVRLPNLFTIPSNIIVGYITLLSPPNVGLSWSLPLIIISSCLIYAAGIIFNDYFDIETDMREGRLRPLSSGSVRKRAAVLLAFIFLAFALVTSAFVGVLSFVVSSAIIIIALLYDYKLKRTKIAAVAMGSARAANIIYGASPILLSGLFESENLQRLMLESACVFMYVAAIIMVSEREASTININRKWLFRPFLLLSLVVLVMFVSAVLGVFRTDLLVNLAFLISIVCFFAYRWIFRFKSGIGSEEIQNLVKILVLCMVILDSAFASGIFGILLGVAVASFIIPGLVLSRLLYVT